MLFIFYCIKQPTTNNVGCEYYDNQDNYWSFQQSNAHNNGFVSLLASLDKNVTVIDNQDDYVFLTSFIFHYMFFIRLLISYGSQL